MTNRAVLARVASVLFLALFLGGCSASKAAGDFLVHPIRMAVVGAPSQPHRALEVKTADGLTLRGWVFQPPAAIPARGVAILVHGKDINRQHLLPWGLTLLEHGYVVVALDQRGHGQSEGANTTYGAHEVDDLRRVIDAVGVQPVTLIGESLGAAVSLQTAAIEPRVEAVVAAASFADLRTLITELRPASFPANTVPEAITWAEKEGSFEVDSISPKRAATSIHARALIIHGLNDTFIAMHHALEIYAALPGPEKKLLALENVSHQDVLRHDEVWAEIVRFLGAP